MRDTDLLRRLRHFGLTVIEIDGWQTRGADTMNPQGALNHHTAGPSAAHGVAPSLGTVINGRPDLTGPLANTFLGRDLIVRLVAAGKANHGGVGTWHAVSGNSHFLGCEVEHTGTDAEPITDALMEAMCRVQAAHAWGLFDASMVAQHCEYATPHGRKIDFCCSRIDPNAFRDRVHDLLVSSGAPAPVAGDPTAPVDLGKPPAITATLFPGAASNSAVAVKYLQHGLNVVLPMWGQAFNVAETGVFDLATVLGLQAFKTGANNKQWQNAPGHLVADRLFVDARDRKAGPQTLQLLRFFAMLGGR